MELSHGLGGVHAIRVHVVQVGGSDAVYQQYVDALERQSAIPLSSIADNIRRFNHHYIHAFPNVNWSSGHLKLELVCAKEDARLSNPWEGLFYDRSVLGMIGILQCSMEEDLDEAYSEFIQLKATYPKVGSFRCFAFDPKDDQVDLMERQDLIMVPNTGHSMEKLDFYLNTLLLDYASFIVEDLAKQLLNEDIESTPTTPFDPSASTPLPTPIRSPLDTEEAMQQYSQSQARKIRAGRLAKRAGDIAFLAGSFEDARQHYEVAIDATKGCGDRIWTAAAYRSLAALYSIVFEPSASTFHEVMGLLRKSQQILIRRERTVSLQAELFFDMAHFVKSYDHSSVSVKKRKVNVNEIGKLGCANYVARAYELCESISAQDQVQLIVEAGLLNQSIGFQRRFSMYMREAALLFCEMYQWPNFMSFLRLALPGYNVPAVGDGTTLVLEQTWNALQKCVLEEAIFASRLLQLPQHLAQYLVYYLRLFGPHVEPETQLKMVKQLYKFVPEPPLSSSVCMSGLPVVTHANVQSLPEETQVHQTVEAAKSDPFLFEPNTMGQDTSPTQLVVCAGDPIRVAVYLSNPYAIDFEVTSMQLCARDSILEPHLYPMFMLPANVCDFRVDLVGVPPREGSLCLSGVRIDMLGMSWEHQLSADGVCSPSYTTRSTHFLDRIRVVPSLPVLEVKMSPIAETLVEGEKKTYSLTLLNGGTAAIDWLRIQLSESIVTKTEQSQATYYASEGTDVSCSIIQEDKNATALAPHMERVVGIRVLAQRWCIGFDLRIEYGIAHAPECHRKMKLSARFTVDSSPCIQSLRLLQGLDKSRCSIPMSPLNRFEHSMFGLEEIQHGDVLVDIVVDNPSPSIYWISCTTQLDGQRRRRPRPVEPHKSIHLLCSIPPMEFKSDLLPLYYTIDKPLEPQCGIIQQGWDILSRHLSVTWSSTSASGIVPLPSTLSSELLCGMMVPPMCLSVTCPPSASVDSIVDVDVSIFITAAVSLDDTILSLTVSQLETQNLEQVDYLGSNTIPLSSAEPKETLQHRFQLCFPRQGNFTLSAACISTKTDKVLPNCTAHANVSVL